MYIYTVSCMFLSKILTKNLSDLMMFTRMNPIIFSMHGEVD